VDVLVGGYQQDKLGDELQHPVVFRLRITAGNTFRKDISVARMGLATVDLLSW